VSFSVRLVVENLTSTDIDFEGQSFHEVQTGKVCTTDALQTILPNQAITFQANVGEDDPSPIAIAHLNERYGVDVAQIYNETFPRVWAYFGGPDGARNGCWQNSTYTIVNRQMGVGQKVSTTMEGHQFEILRENDIDNARLFRIKVLS
jgi:hypothetical protein